MAVVEMKRIHVYALKNNRKKILEMLQRRAAVQVSFPKETGEELNDGPFAKTDTADIREKRSAHQLRCGGAGYLRLL